MAFNGEFGLYAFEASFFSFENLVECVFCFLFESFVEGFRIELNECVWLWFVFQLYVSSSSFRAK